MAARRVAVGDYSPIAVGMRKDEIGELAAAFRAMQDGVAASVSKMTELAHRDALTGLADARAVRRPARAGDRRRLAGGHATSSVLILDLDEFAHVNDTLGHPIGDLLLREVAARLRSVVRRASDSVARVGGDEFAIMMPGSRVERRAARRGGRYGARSRCKMTLDGHVVDVRASIGIAVCPDHGTDPAKLLRARRRRDARGEAGQARYRGLGRALRRERREAPVADERSQARRSTTTSSRSIYQPQGGAGRRGEHYVEALVRWQHPTRGLVPPSEFVPLAEQTGYIRTITQWVLERAIAQCAEWRNRGLPMNVSVNISSRDLIDGELPARLKEMLEKEELRGAMAVARSHRERDRRRARPRAEEPRAPARARLQARGRRLRHRLFDARLSAAPAARRAQDRQVVHDGHGEDASDALIVRSTIELAHKLGLAVVASGVEDEATLEQLRELGCDSVQGFLLSRPLPADDIPGWVKESDWTKSAREKGSLRRVI